MTAAAPAASPAAQDEALDLVRVAVRGLLAQSAAFAALAPAQQRELAHSMVKVCHTAAQLIREEMETAGALAQSTAGEPAPAAGGAGASSRAAGRPARRLARGQSAGTEFSGVAAERVAGTTHAILNAVSFPRFVSELITGVFRAIVDSSQQQMQAYVELLGNVAATTDGFADSALSNHRARVWLAERYPASFELVAEEDDWGRDEADPPPERRLRLRSGASPPTPGALRTDLGIPEEETIPTGDPETALVPLARLALARQKQQMLATLVMLGMQRIVIESGRINAAMRFHIDTRSAAADDRASRFELQNEIAASGSASLGPWGASASVRNSIGYVSTQRTQTTEEMNTDLDLNSSVELYFKSDYVPLDRMAGAGQQDRIRANTLNPDAEAKLVAEARAARDKRHAESDRARRETLDGSLEPKLKLPPAPALPEPKKDAAAPAKPGDPATPPPQRDAGASSSTPARTGAGSNPTAPPQPSGSPAPNRPAPGPAATAPPVAPSSPPTPASARGNAPANPSPATVSPAPAAGQALGATSVSPKPPPRRPDVVFVPSQDAAIVELLRLANAQPGEMVYDLGCGDGRILIAAAQRFGCRAVGFDLDPRRVAEAQLAIAQRALGDRVQVHQQDLFTVDLAPADIVTLYLLPGLNVRLIPQFERLRPGVRIVSHDFAMQGIIPDRAVQVYYPDPGLYKTFYLWSTPLRRERRQVPHQWKESQPIAS